MTTITIPLKFWRDHLNRGCSQSAVEVSRNKMYAVVDFDAESFEDILSDAKFYAEYDAEEGEEDMKAMKASAKATLKRLEKVGA